MERSIHSMPSSPSSEGSLPVDSPRGLHRYLRQLSELIGADHWILSARLRGKGDRLKRATARRYLLLWTVAIPLVLSACHSLPKGIDGKNTGAEEGQESVRANVIRVGIIGDQTFSRDLDASYVILEQGIQALNQENVDIVIHTGDLIESGEPVNDVRARFAEGAGLLDQLKVKWFMTAGDHDVNPPDFQQNSPDRSREALFQKLYGERVPAVLEHPYYSFDVGQFHFIALYSHDTLHATPRFGNIFLARISDDQLRWLADDLERNKTAEAIVVFIHQPLWYNWSGWQRVHELLKEYSVAAVVSGHFHYDQDGGILDGIPYLTVGATGGAVKQGSRNAGSVHHVSILTLQSDERVRLKLIPVSDGHQPLEITPRREMDRVQALDVVLGGLYGFEERNPVFLKGGELVDSCESDAQSAKVTITSIGNAIDLPLNVQIQFSTDSDKVELSSPRFLPDQCQNVISNLKCILASSARIFFSNLSSVSVNTFGDPLWETGLRVVGSEPPAPETALNFDIRLTYDSIGEEFSLNRRATTVISSCPDE